MEKRWEQNLSKCAKSIIAEVRKNNPKKKLSDISEEEFNELKKIGLLWEFYPDAPEFFIDISNK